MDAKEKQEIQDSVKVVKKVYCVRDLLAREYSNMYNDTGDVHGRRKFEMTVNDPNTVPHIHPDHFELHLLGTFNQTDGELTVETPEGMVTLKIVPTVMCNGRDVLWQGESDVNKNNK